jgi:hypothetical protein
MILAGASKSALHPYDGVGSAISIIAIPVVSVRIVPVIRRGIRIEEREPKRVHKDERSIVETAEVMEAVVKNRCVPIVVLAAKRGAGRVIPDRAIIGEPRMGAEVTVKVKLSTAAAISRNMRFVFIDN